MLRYAIRIVCCVSLLFFCLLLGPAARQGVVSAQTAAQVPAVQPTAPANISVRASESAVDESVANDPAVEAVITPYSA